MLNTEMEPPDRRRNLKILNVEKEPLSEEQIAFIEREVKKLKECSLASYYKIGLPYAIFYDYMKHVKKTGSGSSSFSNSPLPDVGPKTFSKRAFIFCLNIFAGAMFGVPVCFYKFQSTVRDYETKRREEYQSHVLETSKEEKTEQELQTVPQTEEIAFPIGTIDITLNEPDGAYASDFDSSTTEKQEEKQTKTYSTTYDELRAIHRSRYAKAQAPPSAQKFESSPSKLSSTSTSSENPTSAPPPRKVTLNKYGDEIE